jgi:hypothetical protein
MIDTDITLLPNYIKVDLARSVIYLNVNKLLSLTHTHATILTSPPPLVQLRLQTGLGV